MLSSKPYQVADYLSTVRTVSKKIVDQDLLLRPKRPLDLSIPTESYLAGSHPSARE